MRMKLVGMLCTLVVLYLVSPAYSMTFDFNDGWILDFEVQGFSVQEGHERLLVSGISAQILRDSRAQLVERSLLDKLLEELKLGTSKLTDRSAALSLGKILAARLIISAQMVYAGPMVQISMRLIETETGRIVAAMNKSFGSAEPASVLVDKLSKELLQELKQLYPLRGMLSEVKDDEIRLNIGELAGTEIGQRFMVIDDDVILEVISIQKDSSLAKVAKGRAVVQEGSRVEVMD